MKQTPVSLPEIENHIGSLHKETEIRSQPLLVGVFGELPEQHSEILELLANIYFIPAAIAHNYSIIGDILPIELVPNRLALVNTSAELNKLDSEGEYLYTVHDIVVIQNLEYQEDLDWLVRNGCKIVLSDEIVDTMKDDVLFILKSWSILMLFNAIVEQLLKRKVDVKPEQDNLSN